MTPPSEPPVLETERLILRRHRPEDLADCLAMWSDPEITRFIGGKPFTPEDVWLRILRYAGLWSLLGFGYWVIRDRMTDRFVGEAGLGDFHRDLDPPLGNFPELGFALAHACWGMGYASEAVNAIVHWSDANLKRTRLVALADYDNEASIRVLTKCGFGVERSAIYKEKQVVIYTR